MVERPSESVFQTAFDVYMNEGTTSNVPPSSLLISLHKVCASKSSGLGTSGKGFPFGLFFGFSPYFFQIAQH